MNCTFLYQTAYSFVQQTDSVLMQSETESVNLQKCVPPWLLPVWMEVSWHFTWWHQPMEVRSSITAHD